MTADFLNGLSVVPLDADQSILSSPVNYADHPWAGLYREREAPPPDHSSKTPSTKGAPYRYTEDSELRGPPAKDEHNDSDDDYMRERQGQIEVHETIRLCDVEAFRKETAEKALEGRRDQIDEISGDLSCLSTSSSSTLRPVIYRYADVIKNSIALLEAIHFELFMPDRSDLRFLAVPFPTVPSGTIEGDYFRVPDVDLLSDPSFAVKLGNSCYPVVWEAKQFEKIELPLWGEESGLAYIMKRKPNGDVGAISDISGSELAIREILFSNEDSKREHSLVHVSTRERAGAHLYPVEPPLPPPTPPPPPPSPPPSPPRWKRGSESNNWRDRSNGTKCIPRNKKGSESNNWRDRKAEEEPEFDPRSEYLKRVYDVRTSSERSGRAVTELRELDASEAERIEDRLGGFTTYGQPGDLELMDKLFHLGSRFRAAASRGEEAKDAGEITIDESIILKTIMDEEMGSIYRCRPLLDCIYGKGEDGEEKGGSEEEEAISSGGVTLNEAQSRAVRLYADADGPRVFCILSPPGSGKTTVAAAMAAAVARFDSYDDVQLLLSVQNVAVDNMGGVLKKMGFSGRSAYNMKSDRKLDPHCPAPFDFFDLMDRYELDEWRTGTQPMERTVERNPRARHLKDRRVETVEFETYEECLKFNRRELEKSLYPTILLSTVEMVLQKLYTNSKLCSDLERVRRIIIDESSLLTEAALYAIILRFPEARIVLIGDDHQLPPFMYDEKILGQELAGRPALTVAMKTGRVPVVELNEVYRAPPSLVAPYNRLAYGGRLVSKKAEGEYPLSEIGLIHSGLPQLLLIDVDGKHVRHEKSKSLYNDKEVIAVTSLLSKFPEEWKDEIMIICLYQEQKKRLQYVLEKAKKNFTVLTVDSAQGKEKSIVILMTTRTEIPKAGTFFDSTERCNVSISRQRKALIILGKETLLTTNKPWSTVVNGDDFTRMKADDIK